MSDGRPLAWVPELTDEGDHVVKRVWGQPSCVYRNCCDVIFAWSFCSESMLSTWGSKRDAISTYTAHRRKADKLLELHFPQLEGPRDYFWSVPDSKCIPCPFQQTFLFIDSFNLSHELQASLCSCNCNNLGPQKKDEEDPDRTSHRLSTAVGIKAFPTLTLFWSMFKPVKLLRPALGRTGYHLCLYMFIQYAILSRMFKDWKCKRGQKLSGNDAILFTPMPGKKWAYPSRNPQEPLFNSWETRTDPTHPAWKNWLNLSTPANCRKLWRKQQFSYVHGIFLWFSYFLWAAGGVGAPCRCSSQQRRMTWLMAAWHQNKIAHKTVVC